MVLTPAFSYYTLQYLHDRAKQPHGLFCSSHIECYALTPSQKQLEKKLPPNVAMVVLPPVESDADDIYLHAYQTTDSLVQQIGDAFPGFFHFRGARIDLEKAYRFNVQHLLCRSEFCFYRSLPDIKDSNAPIFVDILLNRTMLDAFLKSSKRSQYRQYRLESSLMAETLSERFAQLAANRVAPPGQDTISQGGVFAFVGSKRGLDSFIDALQILAKRQPVCLYFYNGKFDLPKSIIESLSEISPVVILDNQSYSSPALAKALAADIRERQHALASLASAEDRAFLCNQFQKLFPILDKLLTCDALFQATRPAIVLGALESNIYSVLCSQLREVYGFRLLNFQHGMKPPTRTLHLARFNAYFVWNELTRNVLEADQYPNLEGVYIIGNPDADKLRTIVAQVDTGHYRQLLGWKGNSQLIVAYTQPNKGLMTAAIKRDFIAALLKYCLDVNPHCKLLVAMHPAETQADIPPDLQASIQQLGTRCHVTLPGGLSLPESLKLADLAVSVYSTTLMEALYIGKPALALDFSHTIRRQELGYDQVLPVVTMPEAVVEALDAQLSQPGAETNQTMDKALRGNFFIPHFEKPYQQRLSDVLDTLVPCTL